MTIKFGFDAAAYYDATLLDVNLGGTGNDISDNFAGLTVFDNIMDLTANYESESVDTTTRAEAKLGWSSEQFTVNKATVSFEMRWDPGQEAFDLLQAAWLSKGFVCMIFLDDLKTVPGSQGLAANWSVSFTKNEPVKGLQTVNVQLAVAQFPDWVYATGGPPATAFTLTAP